MALDPTMPWNIINLGLQATTDWLIEYQVLLAPYAMIVSTQHLLVHWLRYRQHRPSHSSRQHRPSHLDRAPVPSATRGMQGPVPSLAHAHTGTSATNARCKPSCLRVPPTPTNKIRPSDWHPFVSGRCPASVDYLIVTLIYIFSSFL